MRTPLLIGVGLMAIGALLAAAAPNFEALLTARLIQGAGAGAVPTLGVMVITGRYAGAVRSLALGRLAAIAAAINALGPLAGGVAEMLLGWRAVLALPVLGLLVVPLVWDTLSVDGSGEGLDVLGALLVVAASAGGGVLLIQSPSTGIAVAGAVLVAVGVPAVSWWIRRRPEGFLPLDVVHNRVVVRSSVAAASVPAAWFASLVAVPAVMLDAGWRPYQVGLLLLPCVVLSVALPRVAGRLIADIGPVRAIGVAAVIASAAMAIGAIGAHRGSSLGMAVALMGVCAAFGIGQPALNEAVGLAVDVAVRGVAMGVATLVFMVGGSVGSAVAGGLAGWIGIGGSLAVLSLVPLLTLVALRGEAGRIPL